MPFCIPNHSRYKKATSTRTSPVVMVTPYLNGIGGEATVFGKKDSKIKWRSHSDKNSVVINDSGEYSTSCPTRLTPGTYSVYIDDNECEIEFEVKLTNYPTVMGYEVKSASGELSRDGEIRVKMNIEDGIDVLIAWSNGSFTTNNILKNVKPGLYVATLLKIQGKVVPCIHASEPAQVGVSGE